MPKIPTISIIIPLYNKRDQISSTLESVLQQSFQDFEIIVIDDDSTDGSADAMSEYLHKVRYVHQQNSGPSAARNHGIELSLGKYIAFLDADDVWEVDKLKHQIVFLNEHPEIQWCATNYRIETDGVVEFSPVSFEGWLIVDDWFTAHLNELKSKLSVTSGILIDRALFESAGVFDTAIPAGQDFDLWVRIALQAKKYAFSSEPLWVYRKTNDSVSSASDVKFDSVTKLYEKHIRLCEQQNNDSYEKFIRVTCEEFIKRTIAHGKPELFRRMWNLYPSSWKSSRLWGFRLLSQMPPFLQKIVTHLYRSVKNLV